MADPRRRERRSRASCRRRAAAAAASAIVAVALAPAPALARAADAGASVSPPPPALRAADARAMFRATLSDVITRPVTPVRPAAVVSYRGDTVARLADGRMLVSNYPLRARDASGAARPLDLSLRAVGATFAPASAPFALEVAADPAAGFTLGPDAGRAVTVTPAALDDGHGMFARLGDQLVADGTRRSTDTLLRPTVTGVESFEQLRDATAPERFAWKLHLAEGQTLAARGGGAAVLDRGRTVLRVLPPVSRDADRDDVPTRLAVTAPATIEVHVEHRRAGVRYPVVLDPAWQSGYDWIGEPATGNEGWAESDEPAAGGPWYELFAAADGPEGFAPGLTAYPVGGKVYPPGSARGIISWQSPGTTRIQQVTFRDVSAYDDRDRQIMRLALYGSATPRTFDFFDAEVVLTVPSITLTDPTATSTLAQLWEYTPPCNPSGEANCPRFVATNTRSFVNVGAVDLVLTDDDTPTVEAGGTLLDLAETWTRGAETARVTPTFRDAGSGVASYRFAGTDAAGEHPVDVAGAPCDTLHTTPGQGSNICPFAFSPGTYALDLGLLPQGLTTFSLNAADYAGNTSQAGGGTVAWRVFVDGVAPGVALGDDVDGAWRRTDRPLRLRATATDERSGIASYGLRVVDEGGSVPVDRTVEPCVPRGPIEAPCPTQHATTFALDGEQLEEGELDVTATAQDHAGNPAAPAAATLRLDRTPPAAVAEGALEDLADEPTAETGSIPVVLRGRDRLSGVRRLELLAVNDDGREVVAAADVCDVAVLPAGDRCPSTAEERVAVDVGDLPDGATRFEARALDLAGWTTRDGESWSTYVDHTPPGAPTGLTVLAAETDALAIRWDRVQDAPGGSGVARYEYQVQVEGQPATTWQSTPTPGVTLSGLPSDVRVDLLVRAIDDAGNAGRPASLTTGTLAFVAASAASAGAGSTVTYGRLAELYKPVVEVQRSDEGFWPIDFETVFRLRGEPHEENANPNATCRRRRIDRRRPGSCVPVGSSDLGVQADTGLFLDYPEDLGTGGQREMFERALGNRNPYAGTTVFYPYTGLSPRRAAGGKLTLQYWWFYGYNHLGALSIGHHEGDWEHMSIVFSGRRDDQARTLRDPRPQAAFFVTHGGLGEPVDWNGVRRIGRGDNCDTSTRVRTPRRVAKWICAYAARASHATYPRPGHYQRDAIFDDDDATANHSNRWHLHASARLEGLRGHAWACWAGSAGAPTSAAATSQHITPPRMPLQQQGAYGSERCDVRERSARARPRAAGTGDLQASGRTGDPDLDALDECAEWAPPVYARGETRIVACDQARLDRWLGDPDDPDAQRTMTFLSETSGDDAGPSIVAKRSLPTAQLGDLRLQVRAAVSPELVIETLGDDRRLERVRFEDLVLAPGSEIRFRRDPSGTVEFLDRAGTVIARGTPDRESLRLGPAARPGWAASQPRLKRIAPRRARLRWNVAEPITGVRFVVTATTRAGARSIIARVRARTRRASYEIRPRIPRGTVSVRIRSIRGRRSVTTGPIGFAPKSRFLPPGP